MSEPIAHCQFQLTKELFLESSACVHADNMGKTWKRSMLILLILWIAVALFTFMTGGGIGFVAWELIVIAFFAVVTAVWMPRRRASKAWENLIMLGKADTDREIRFYEDYLEIECNEEITTMAYDDISKSLESKNALIFIGTDKKGIIVKKDSLYGCEQEELLQIVLK